MENRIKVSNIKKSFGKQMVLKDISFTVKEGEIFGFLGPSGAGKTTLIKILTGQLPADQGEAELFGISSREFGRHVYRRLGMVMDDLGLYERLSCQDNMLLSARLYRVDKKEIGPLLERLDLGQAARKPVSSLSKGMKQRLAIARALLPRPDILFLDEPTSALDPATANKIHSLLMEEQSRGTAIFLTTHRMEEAAKLCDSIALLHQGNIVEYGNPLEICRKYNHLNRINILQRDGKEIYLPNDSSSAELLASCVRENKIESIHSTEPNLETVFMELTGRGLGA